MGNLYIKTSTTITPSTAIFQDTYLSKVFGANANISARGYTLLSTPTGTQSNTTVLVANVDTSGNWTTNWMDVVAYRKIDGTRRHANIIRNKRNSLLTASDWTQGADSPLTADQKTAWATYRTALRNLPSAPGFPFTHVWPTKPQ
jgi:hypothetical protein